MEYMTVQEASDLWGYTPDTIRRWCKSGKISLTIHPEKISNRWKIPKDAPCPKPIKKRKE